MPAYAKTSLLADSGINDQLVKLYPLIDQTCFKFINVSYFVICHFQNKLLNTRKLLNHVAPSVELKMQMSNLMLIITALRNNLKHLRLTW